MSRDEFVDATDRAKDYAGRAAAWIIVVGFLISPLVLIALNWGKPLYGTKTVVVEKTVGYGLIPSVSPWIALWVLIILVCWAAVVGPAPGRLR